MTNGNIARKKGYFTAVEATDTITILSQDSNDVTPYFPVFMDIKDQPVLVVGGGDVAARKVRALLKAGARVSVVAEVRGEEIDRLYSEGSIDWIGRYFAPELVEGCRLVFAATDDARVNQEVYEAGEARGIPVNSVDDIAHCRFISPAVVNREPVQVAISTGGTSPVLARKIRGWIERLLPLGLGRVARAAGMVRKSAAGRLGLTERRRFWEAALNRASLVRLSTKSVAEISKSFRTALAGSPDAKPEGRVYLVGAGPGRPDLLTLRALEVLQMADVILHDRLVPQAILDLARGDARRIDVGKRVGNHHGVQQRIFDLLVELAGEGNTVVRLKGGDPFVFGRGGEELQVLRRYGIDYEVVPGLTAAIGCAAYAGIPLTHRELAHRVTLMTGHTAAESGVDVTAAQEGAAETLVIYMGVKQAAEVRRQLLDQGYPALTPAALVVNGTMDSQRVVPGSIDSLPGMARQVEDGAPGLFIIGNVAALGQTLSWFQTEHGWEAAA